MNILLDYLFPVTAIAPTAQASTAFLKQVLVVVKPKGGVTPGTISTVTSSSGITALTDNTDAQKLLDAGMTSIFMLPMSQLDLASAIAGRESDFNTILISSDFTDAEVLATQAAGTFTVTAYANLVSGTPDTVTVAGQVFTAQAGVATPGAATFQAVTSNNVTAASLAAQINAHAVTSALVTASVVGAVVTITAKSAGNAGNSIALAYTDNDVNVGLTKSGTALAGGDGLFAGQFKGVLGLSSTDDTYLATQAAIENRVAFHRKVENGAKNMFYAFGKLLSNGVDWLNQQYVTLPESDDVATVGAAVNLFNQRISFAISDSQYGSRLAMFAAGGKAIVAPYITKNLQLDMQSKALTYISGNQPGYTKTHAALLEDELQKVIDGYVSRGWLEDGVVEVKLVQSNFVASGYINISEPKALWRIEGQIKQTL